MVPTVAHSMLLLQLLLLIPAGPMVLLTSTYYAARGCHSNNGNSCGVFCIAANTTASDPYWGIGSALLIYTLCSSWS